MAATDTLWVPTHVADRINQQKRLIAYVKHRELMKKDAAYRESYEQKIRDTKPMMYVDTDTRNRPVIVVGGKGMWYHDMKDLAQRLKEKPDAAKELPQRDVKADVATAIDRRLRGSRGTTVFHIKNNPCRSEEDHNA